MSTVIAIGASLPNAPLPVLEALAIDADRLPKLLDDLASRDHISEAVIISTCNRLEVFVVAEKFHGAYRDVRDFLSDHSYLTPDRFADHLMVVHDDDATRHLFRVASGLDSLVVGEHEILGQVRGAWDTARDLGVCGPVLNLLFRHALEVGKRARTETAIARQVTSVSHAAVILAEAECGSLEGRSIAVVGAGSMARGVVDFALGREVGSVTVLNRTVARAEALAGEHGRWGSLDELHEVLTHVDVVVTATSSPDPVLDVEDLAPVVALREGRLLVVIDLAVPRNVGAGVASVDGVVLHDMDALGRFADAGLDSRRREVPAVEAIVDAEVDRYISARAARQVAPLVAALHRRGDEVIEAELQRGASRLAGLGDADRAAMEATLRAVVSKLLHDPTVRLKDAAGSPRGDRLAGSLRELFGL